jgi:hypothetical protein
MRVVWVYFDMRRAYAHPSIYVMCTFVYSDSEAKPTYLRYNDWMTMKMIDAWIYEYS